MKYMKLNMREYLSAKCVINWKHEIPISITMEWSAHTIKHWMSVLFTWIIRVTRKMARSLKTHSAILETIWINMNNATHSMTWYPDGKLQHFRKEHNWTMNDITIWAPQRQNVLFSVPIGFHSYERYWFPNIRNKMKQSNERERKPKKETISHLSSLLNYFVNWIETLRAVKEVFSQSHSPLFGSFWLNFYDIYWTRHASEFFPSSSSSFSFFRCMCVVFSAHKWQYCCTHTHAYSLLHSHSWNTPNTLTLIRWLTFTIGIQKKNWTNRCLAGNFATLLLSIYVCCVWNAHRKAEHRRKRDSESASSERYRMTQRQKEREKNTYTP